MLWSARLRLRSKFCFDDYFGGAEVEMGNRSVNVFGSTIWFSLQDDSSGSAYYRKPGIGFRSRENASLVLYEKGKNLPSQWHGALCDTNLELFIFSIALFSPWFPPLAPGVLHYHPSSVPLFYLMS